MHERRVESSNDLSEECQIGHDLSAGLRLLRAPNSLLNIGRIRIRTEHRRDPQEDVNARQLHEVFRYGVPITMEAEIKAEIEKVLDWIEEKLNEGF